MSLSSPYPQSESAARDEGELDSLLRRFAALSGSLAIEVENYDSNLTRLTGPSDLKGANGPAAQGLHQIPMGHLNRLRDELNTLENVLKSLSGNNARFCKVV